MTRRQLRECIFHVLFRVEFNKEDEWQEQLDLYMDELEHPAAVELISLDPIRNEKPEVTSDEETEQKYDSDVQRRRTISQILEEADMKVTDVTDLDLVYIRQKTGQIFEKLPEIDAEIARNTEGWALNRIGKTELTILRLAIFELLYDDDVPEKVAINEAVELSKIYSRDEAKGFVNAVLAKFTK